MSSLPIYVQYAIVFIALLTAAEVSAEQAVPAKCDSKAVGETGAGLSKPQLPKQNISNTIPVQTIWAYEIPGTKDVTELEPPIGNEGLPTREILKKSAIWRINRSLARWMQGPPKREKVGPGFAVIGHGSEALSNAHKVFVEKKKSTIAFEKSDQEMSLVFFTALSGFYVEIDKVERKNNRFRIHYHPVSHGTLEVTTHFALIPVGSLSSGGYAVELVRGKLKLKDRFGRRTEPSPERISKTFCESFEFSIK